MALCFDRKKDFHVDPRLDAVRFTRKRKPGRPKNIGLALEREPPVQREGDEGEEDGGEGAVDDTETLQEGDGGGQQERGFGVHQVQVPAHLWSSLPIHLGDIRVNQMEAGTSSHADNDTVEQLDWNME